MALPNHYQTLGVSETATAEEIKRAYRRLAQEFHPDHNAGDTAAEQRFKEIAEAHRILGDPHQRTLYNRLRSTPPKTAAAGQSVANKTTRAAAKAAARAAKDMGAFFGAFFGDGDGPKSKAPPGRDLSATVAIPFIIAIRGGQQSLTIKRETPCGRCKGRGAEPDTPVADCPACRGSGQVTFDEGTYSITRACQHCQGRGKLPRVTCRMCGGKGVSVTERTITIAIPAGIKTGTRLRIPGEGEAGYNGGANGDLFVNVMVQDHSGWRRDAEDIHSEETINIAQAVLGDTLQIDTVDGPVSLRIPAGTQPETLFKLRGRGIQQEGDTGKRGDHYVRVHVTVPRDLSDDASRRFEKFVQSTGMRRTTRS